MSDLSSSIRKTKLTFRSPVAPASCACSGMMIEPPALSQSRETVILILGPARKVTSAEARPTPAGER
jgi:hypothetical protein